MGVSFELAEVVMPFSDSADTGGLAVPLVEEPTIYK
jgi:hypothetical protein